MLQVSLILNHLAHPQVNPQLYEWLAIINGIQIAREGITTLVSAINGLFYLNGCVKTHFGYSLGYSWATIAHSP